MLQVAERSTFANAAPQLQTVTYVTYLPHQDQDRSLQDAE